jgi:outer membrane protein assembly factor BamD
VVRQGREGSFVYTRGYHSFGPYPMMRRLLVPILALMIVAGCATDRNADQQRLARLEPSILYKRGAQAARAGNYEEAVATFEALVARYPFTAEARQGRLDVIHAYYKLGEKESAKDSAETFIRENPAHERLDYVWYLKGLIDFERTPYTVERWLRVDLSARVPKTAADSFESFKTLVESFPQSPYAAEGRRRMIYLRNRLAGYEMQVARHYMERGAWVAAAQRANQTIEQYDGAPVVIDALRVMYRCYNELDYKDLAENTEKVFRENFPNEKLETTAQSSRRWWKPWSKG